MNRKLICKLALALLVSGGIASAQPQLITFDDFGITFGEPIDNGYAGFDWNNFWVYSSYVSPSSGYYYGTITSPNVAFNAGGNPASFYSTSGTFELTSAYLTDAWYNNDSVTVTGWNGGSLLYTQTYNLSDTIPDFITFDWKNITEVDFSSRLNSQVAFDNILINGSVVPDGGMTSLLFGGALFGLGLLRRKLA